MRKIKLVIFSLIICNYAFCQWYKLPYTPSVTYNFNNTVYYPSFIQPLANGKIVYTVFTQAPGSSGNSMSLNFSKNDMNSNTVIANAQYFMCCVQFGPIKPLNDSSYAYDMFGLLGSNPNHVYYTNNNFVSNSGLLFAPPPYNYSTLDIAVTNNFIYSVYSGYPNSDTLLLYKSVKTAASPTVKKLTGYYNSYAKTYFTDDNNGYLLCRSKPNPNKYFLLKTIDFGSNWSVSLVDSLDKPIAFSFPSANIGYVLYANGTILKTTNAGASWLNATPVGASGLTSISFGKDSLGYVGGAGGVLKKTVDGGITWTNEISNTTHKINNIFSFDTVSYFVDSVMATYKNMPYIGYGVGLKTNTINDHKIIIYPNPATDYLFLNMGQRSSKTVSVFDITGNLILKKSGPVNSLNVSEFKSGTYFLYIEFEDESLSQSIFSVIK